jgi:hypothetical protein
VNVPERESNLNNKLPADPDALKNNKIKDDDHSPEISLLGEEFSDLETTLGMQQLLKLMGKSYKQSRISLKYFDQSLEDEFLKSFQPKIISFAKLYMIISQIVASFHFCHSFYRALNSEEGKNHEALKITLVISAVLMLFCLGLYFLARKYIFVAKYFANIQTLTFIISTMEFTIQAGALF